MTSQRRMRKPGAVGDRDVGVRKLTPTYACRILRRYWDNIVVYLYYRFARPASGGGQRTAAQNANLESP
jgi:hypothetical protein